LYLDSSAYLKRYLAERGSESCEAILLADSEWATARHTLVEVRRNLARALRGSALATARRYFDRDFRRSYCVELDARTCALAARLAETTGVRSLDALHLAAAGRIGRDARFVTYDGRLARAARELGWMVLGA
jgi:predicted nucleic acid-binding protein